jgi:hypothetical protein
MGSALAVTTAMIFLLRIGMAGGGANSTLSAETGGFRPGKSARSRIVTARALSALTLRRRGDPALQAADLG